MIDRGELIAWLLASATVLIAALVWAFRTFSTKWLDSRFASQLEVLRHQQLTELERWKTDAARDLDRAARLAQREFEAIPDTWAKLTDSYNKVRSATSAFKRRPDLSRMSEKHLEIYMRNIDLPELHKTEIADAPQAERNDLFGRSITLTEIERARDAYWRASDALNGNSIFLDEETVDRIRAFLDELWRVIVEFGFSREERDNLERDGPTNIFRREGQERFHELERHMRRRYFPE